MVECEVGQSKVIVQQLQMDNKKLENQEIIAEEFQNDTFK
jgi:hypothetical protein